MLCPMHKPKKAWAELSYFAVFRVCVQRDGGAADAASIVPRGSPTFRVAASSSTPSAQLLPQQMPTFHSPTALFPRQAPRGQPACVHKATFRQPAAAFSSCFHREQGQPACVLIRVVEQGHEDCRLSDTWPKVRRIPAA